MEDLRKIIVLDPHSTDFIFDNIYFRFFGRKNLRKYRFISDIEGIEYGYSGFVSALSKKLNYALPAGLIKLISFVEFSICARKFGFSRSKISGDHTIFLFGYKAYNSLKYLLKNYTNDIVLHLSHYHTYEKDLILLINQNIDRVLLCYDNDISKVKYFSDRFDSGIRYKLSFGVNERFQLHNTESTRKYRLGLVGTYHELPKETYEGLETFDGKFASLHPNRYYAAHVVAKGNKECINSKLNRYSPNGAGIDKQSDYFAFDMVEFLNDCDYIICPSEGTGALPVGMFEAAACGCGLILSRVEFEMLGVANMNGIIVYDSLADLERIILQACDLPKTIDRYSIRQSFLNYLKSDNLLM